MPSMSAPTPCPPIADPKYSGCTEPSAVRAASAASSSSGVGGGPSTARARTSSSASARSSVSRARTAGVSGRSGVVRASGVPASRTAAIGTTCGARVRRMSATSASVRAPARSILLTNSRVGSRSRRSVFIRTRVRACTPSTADRSSTAPSRTPRARSTSAMKSECPGVSIRLTWTSPDVKEATADRIVMPRARSMAPLSVRVSPASTLPSRSMAPVAYRSRSVRLVLPASTWARMPMFRVCMGGRDLKNCRPVRALSSSEVSAHSVAPA